MPDWSLIPDLSGQANKTTAARQTLNKAQEGQQSDYLSRFRGAIAGQETVPAMYNRIAEETGFNQAAKTNAAMQTQLANLPYTYGKATRGFDVNANQLERLTAQKASELAPTVTAAANQYAASKDMMTALMGATQAQQAKELSSYPVEQQMMSERMAREYSGFDNDAQREYQALVDKMNAGIKLSIAEEDRKAQLEVAKMQYDSAIKVAELNNANKPQYSSTTGGAIYNAMTGKIMSSMGEGW